MLADEKYFEKTFKNGYSFKYFINKENGNGIIYDRNNKPTKLNSGIQPKLLYCLLQHKEKEWISGEIIYKAVWGYNGPEKNYRAEQKKIREKDFHDSVRSTLKNLRKKTDFFIKIKHEKGRGFYYSEIEHDTLRIFFKNMKKQFFEYIKVKVAQEEINDKYTLIKDMLRTYYSVVQSIANEKNGGNSSSIHQINTKTNILEILEDVKIECSDILMCENMNKTAVEIHYLLSDIYFNFYFTEKEQLYLENYFYHSNIAISHDHFMSIRNRLHSCIDNNLNISMNDQLKLLKQLKDISKADNIRLTKLICEKMKKYSQKELEKDDRLLKRFSVIEQDIQDKYDMYMKSKK